MGSQGYSCRYGCGRELKSPQARNVHEGTCKARTESLEQENQGKPKTAPRGGSKGPTKDQLLGRRDKTPKEDQDQGGDNAYGCSNCRQPVKYRQSRCSNCGTELNWEGV